MSTAKVVIAVLLSLGMMSCMRTVSMNDPALRPFDSMYSVDRGAYGFTALPKTGVVSIEGKSLHGDYDAMLHFGGNPSRTIAFRSNGKAYEWLGEEEIFEGPQVYETPDGRLHEEVSISYYRERLDGEFQGLTIDYRGPDTRLMMPKPDRPNWSLTLAEVNPLLEKWGFRKAAE